MRYGGDKNLECCASDTFQLIISQVQVTCSAIGEETEQSRKNSDFECRHHYDQILSSLVTTLCHFVALSEPYKSLLGCKMERIQRNRENMGEMSAVFPEHISVHEMLGFSFLLTYPEYFKYSGSPLTCIFKSTSVMAPGLSMASKTR